ncbi:MAG TPA: hypothetical protein PLI45_04920 [Candidatus Woesebacteria bacterium]|nr:hypothetical protein [Candidatus Woesebacteria bacterium]
MDKTIACVNFVNYSNITKEGDPDHKGATLPTTYDKNHRFDVSSISLKGDSEYIVNDRVVIKNIAHFVKLDVRTEDSTEFFTFLDGRPIDILRVFINGVSFRYEYPPSKICTLKPLDIIEIQFLDTNKRILYTNIIVIKSIKFIEE